jgi:hypothetical protein
VIRDDYLIRLIRQFVEALARIAGFRRRGEYERAQVEIGRVWDELGVPRELIVTTDRETAAGLLREPDRMRTAAMLLAEEAHVMQAKGDPLHAAMLRRRAVELLIRARERDPSGDDDVMIAELGRHLPPAVLTEAIAPDRE